MVIKPSEAEFVRLAKRGNVVPIYLECSADVLTPVQAFQKVAHSPYAYLLESVEGEARYARYSFIGFDPRMVISSDGRTISIRQAGWKRPQQVPMERGPVQALEKLMSRFTYVARPELPRFSGGLVGYLAYDVARFFERIPDTKPDTLNAPEMVMLLSDRLVVFDHLKHTVQIILNAMVEGDARRTYRRSVKDLETMADVLLRPGPAGMTPARRRRGGTRSVTSNTSRSAFLRAVKRAKAYVKAGDVVQVVLSQRFQQPLRTDNLTLYRALRSINPSPYMYYLKLDDTALIGSSPELFVRCEDGIVQTRPIAGTRRRGKTEEEDEALAKELLSDVKERAEHTMLVDLGRNDLGRVCDYGTVKVTELMAIERYSHVMHIVSNVAGHLAKDKTIYEVLAACFPAGTVAGAPKIRAMEIIDELEPDRRGPYAGCVGYISFSGNLDTCITIRTILALGGMAYVQAGAGIVADSVPGREYEETVNKSKGMLAAIEAAERGLEMGSDLDYVK